MSGDVHVQFCERLRGRFPRSTHLLIYILLVMISLFMVVPLRQELEQKYPSLVDRRWKRKTWIISFLIFLPMVVMLATVPSYMLNELRKFIRGDKK